MPTMRQTPDAPRGWRVPAETAAAVTALSADLSALAEQLRDRFDRRSERWRDSDDAVQVDGWIDDLGQLAEDLEAFEPAADI